MMTTSVFVIANVKKLRTSCSFRILLPFFRTSWGVGVLNSAIFNSFHNRVEFDTILESFRNFGGGGVWTPQPLPPSVRHWFTPQRVALKIIKSSKNVRQPLSMLHATCLICQIMYWKRMLWIQTVELKYSIYKTQTSLNAIMLFLLFSYFFIHIISMQISFLYKQRNMQQTSPSYHEDIFFILDIILNHTLLLGRYCKIMPHCHIVFQCLTCNQNLKSL